MNALAPREFLGAQIAIAFPTPGYPTKDELLQYFDYDPQTGSLKNRINRGPAKAGKEAGRKLAMRHGIADRWYRRVSFKGREYLAHVLVIIMAGGFIASGLEIDHINGLGHDNRVENLRIVTHSENMKNTRRARAKATVTATA